MDPQGMYLNIITSIALYSTYIPLVFILLIKTRTYFKLKWVLFILIGLGLTIDYLLGTPYFGSLPDMMYNFYTIVCILTSIAVYNQVLSDSFSRKLSIYLFSTLFIGFIFSMIYTQDINIDSSTAYLIFSIIVVILSLLYFRTVLNEMKIPNLYGHPPFWIVFAYLTYYGGTISLTLFQDYIIGGNLDVYIILWSIQLIANIIFSILISISIWKMRKT